MQRVTREPLPALHDVMERDVGPYLATVAELLAGKPRLRGRRGERLAAQLDLVLRFESWELLCRRAGGDRKAADLAADLVRSAAQQVG